MITKFIIVGALAVTLLGGCSENNTTKTATGESLVIDFLAVLLHIMLHTILHLAGFLEALINVCPH